RACREHRQGQRPRQGAAFHHSPYGGHTRRSVLAANRPPGRSMSTATRIASAASGTRADPAYPDTYESATPSDSPPITAPGGLSRPPRTAATKPLMRIGSKLLGPRNTEGETRSPASVPATAASA